MHKKIISLALCALLGVSCLGVSACGETKEPYDPYAQYKATKEEWGQMLSTQRFNFHIHDCVTDGGFDVLFTNGDYEVKTYERSVEKYVTYLYDVETVGGETVTTLSKRADGETEWSEPQTVETPIHDYSTEYFSPFLNFVKENYDNFEFFINTYVYNAKGDELAELGELIGARSGNEDAYVDVVKVYISQDSTGEKRISDITFDCKGNQQASYLNRVDFRAVGTALLNRDYENAVAGLNNFTLVGGTGVDYGEYTFTENAFRIYTPNIEDPTRQEAFWQKDGEQYIYYSKNAQGAWQKDATKTEQQYKNAREGITDLLFGCLTKQNKYFSSKNDGKTYLAAHAQVDVGLYNYTYYNFVVTLDDAGKITGATYNLKMTIGQASSEHSFVLTAGNAAITFPTV